MAKSALKTALKSSVRAKDSQQVLACPSSNLVLRQTNLIICNKLPAFQDLNIASPKDTAWLHFWLRNIHVEPAMTRQELLNARVRIQNAAGVCRCTAGHMRAKTISLKVLDTYGLKETKMRWSKTILL